MPERYVGRSLGRYQVRELVGSGGFAWVYRAYDADLEIDVALKVLKPHFAGDAAIVERFRREATTAAKLRHPNIVTVLAVGREGDAPYVAMDFLPGSLAARLAAAGTLPETELLRMGADVAKALAYAHANGIVHRDIKVDNVLLDASGNAVVADFGIARALADAAAHSLGSQIVGTPQYFSPEQARGLPLDGRTDVYALGVTLYRAATGALPFAGDDWYAVMRQHIEVPAPSPRDLNAALSPATEEIVLRCLEKEPDARYADAESLCNALEQAAARIVTGEHEDATDTVMLSRAEARRAVARPRSAVRRLAPLAAVLVLASGAGALALALVNRAGTASAVAPTVRLPGDTVDGTGGLLGAALPPDSTILTQDSARADTAPRAAEPLGALDVRAPDNAQITLDGRPVGRGRVFRQNLRPGTYTVAARIQSRPGYTGCETVAATRSVYVAPGPRAEIVELAPRACGRLRLEIQPATRRLTYTLVDEETRRRYTGVVSAAPIILPAGRYQLIVDAGEGCPQYIVPVLEVPPDGEPPVERAKMMCS